MPRASGHKLEQPERVCETCRFWSDQQVRIDADKVVFAKCLGRKTREYRASYETCIRWKIADQGALDDLDLDPARYDAVPCSTA